MKKFKDFLKEQPTNHVGNGGFTNAANPDGPVAGFDKKLFPGDEDLLDQGFQAPGETGQDRYNRFFGVIPVQKMNLDTKLDGEPSIDSMVAASKEFVELEAEKVVNKMKRTYQQFMGYR